jgi:hypothetical protein
VTSGINGADLAKQIDTYSNAIVGFVVLQSLTYSYSFGTSAMFNCLVKTANHLAVGLSLHFSLTTILSMVGMFYLSKTVVAITGEYAEIVRKIYLGKLVAVVLFSLLPIGLTVAYGIVDDHPKYDCKRTVPPTSAVPAFNRSNHFQFNAQAADTVIVAMHNPPSFRTATRKLLIRDDAAAICA